MRRALAGIEIERGGPGLDPRVEAPSWSSNRASGILKDRGTGTEDFAALARGVSEHRR
jgi:hypothetical protein